MSDDDKEHSASSSRTVPPPPGETNIYQAKTRVGGLSDEVLNTLREIDEVDASHDRRSDAEAAAEPEVARPVSSRPLDRELEVAPLGPPATAPASSAKLVRPVTDAPAPSASAAVSTRAAAQKRHPLRRALLLLAIVAVVASAAVVVRAGGVSHVHLLRSYPWVQLNN